MAIEYKQPGKNTYHYTIITAIFEGYSYLTGALREIAEEARAQTEGGFKKVDINTYPRTNLGPSASLVIDDIYSLEYIAAIFRDGWRIKLLANTDMYSEREINKKVFGMSGRSSVWTRETEKVPGIIAQLAKEAREAVRWEA